MTSARTVSVGTRSRRQTSGNSCSSANVANCRSGTMRPLGVGTCSELKRLERHPLVVGGARDHVDEIDVVAQLRDGRAGDGGVEHGRERARADAQPARLVLVDVDADLPRRLHPVEVHVPRPRVGGEHLGELERDPAHLVLVRARDPVLQRPADRRAQLERRHARDDVGELLGERLLQLLLQPLARLAGPWRRSRTARRTDWRAGR